jgi:competence protein ComEC
VGALSQSWTSPWRTGLLCVGVALVAMWQQKAVLVVLACAMLLGSAVMSLRQVGLQTSQVHRFIGSTSTIQFQISTDPTKTQSKVFGSTLAPTSYSFLATALQMSDENQRYRLRVPIRVIAQNQLVRGLLPGQMITAEGAIRASKEARVAAMFLVRGDIGVDTKPSHWASALGSIRTHLRALCGTDDAGALIPGMVLGDTALQSVNFKNDMRRSGLTHLVAVSGANFAIISLFVLWCMQWIFRSLRLRLIFTAVALSSFIALVRPSPSVLRAAAMAGVVLVARGVGKRSDPLATLGFAIAAVVIGDPWQARDPGFALSVLATAGLLLLSPRIGRWLSKFVPTFVANSLSPPIAAVLMCAPILVALSGYLGLMTVAANLLAAPMVAPITIIGFLAALISPLSPTLSSLLLFIIRWPAMWIAGVAHWAAGFPVLQMSSGLWGLIDGIVVICLLIVTVILLRKAHKVMMVILLIMALTFAWFGQWPVGDWQIVNCDVGQGDSLVVNLGNHRGVVIDTGPDAALEDRCLSRLGITSVALLILTHFHADHVEGVAGLIRGRSVGQVWVSNNAEPVLESQRVYSWLAKIPKIVAVRGTSVNLESRRGPISIRTLWPDDGTHSFDVLPGDGSAINNSSIAVSITSPDFSLFAGGDLEPSAQSEILDSVGQVDVYKVSHHGSAYQDQAFMDRLSPTISIISVGAGNSFGHPAAQTIGALVRLRSRIYRTDESGGIAITARAHHFTIHTSAGAWWQKVRLG